MHGPAIRTTGLRIDRIGVGTIDRPHTTRARRLRGRLGKLHPPEALLAPGLFDVGELAGIAVLDLAVMLAQQRKPPLRMDRTQNGLDKNRIQSIHDDLGNSLSQLPRSKPSGHCITSGPTGSHGGHQIVAGGHRKTVQKVRTGGWHRKPRDSKAYREDGIRTATKGKAPRAPGSAFGGPRRGATADYRGSTKNRGNGQVRVEKTGKTGKTPK